MKMLAQRLIDQYRVSKQRACQVIQLHRSAMYYTKCKRDDDAIRKRITEIAQTRIRYGFQRIHTLLRREGWKDNLKRVYRIYKEEGLNLRTKRPRRNKSAAHRLECPELTGPFRYGRWILWRISYLTVGNSGP